jgi:hypothetical protein
MKNQHSGVQIMAGAAAGAESTTARLGLPAASRCVRQHKGEHVHKKVPVYACKVGALRLEHQTRGGDGMRPLVAKRGLDDVAGVAGAGKGSRGCAQERVYGFKNVLALAPPGRSRLTVVKRRRAQFDRGN